jgi:hypothetical protein
VVPSDREGLPSAEERFQSLEIVLHRPCFDLRVSKNRENDGDGGGMIRRRDGSHVISPGAEVAGRWPVWQGGRAHGADAGLEWHEAGLTTNHFAAPRQKRTSGNGEFTLAQARVTSKAGVVRDEKGSLAGSALTMSMAAKNLLAMVPQASPFTLARIASANPAALIAARGYGAIQKGNVARFTVLAADGSCSSLRF